MATEQYSIGYEEGYQAGWNAAMESLPAPVQQEPVAWIVEDQSGERLEWASDAHSCHGVPTFPLYTSPPSQRTRVGLTESEKSAALYDKNGMTLEYEDYAYAIEAKLKEKNT